MKSNGRYRKKNVCCDDLFQSNSSLVCHTIYASLCCSPPAPSSLIRPLIDLFNLILFLLASDSPPPPAPALTPDPGFSGTILILYPAIVTSFNCQVDPSNDICQPIDHQQPEDGRENGDYGSQECNCRYLTSQTAGSKFETLRPQGADVFVADWSQKREHSRETIFRKRETCRRLKLR